MSLHQDPRTNIFLFRKVIPEALRPFFGKREFKVSLNERASAIRSRAPESRPSASHQKRNLEVCQPERRQVTVNRLAGITLSTTGADAT
jgi:hypothetical protein